MQWAGAGSVGISLDPALLADLPMPIRRLSLRCPTATKSSARIIWAWRLRWSRSAFISLFACRKSQKLRR